MACPQKENGYTPIANELMENLAQTHLGGYETRYLLVLLRKTYGWNKKCDVISNSQFVKETGLKKQHIWRTEQILIKRNIVTKNGYKLSLNKDWESWIKLPKMVTELPKMVTKVTKNGGHKRQKHLTKEILPNGKDLSLKKKKMEYTQIPLNDDGEIVVKRKGMKRPVTENPEPFDQKKLLAKLLSSPAKVHKISGHYIARKGFRYGNYEQWEPDLARIMHAAKGLKGYNAQQVELTMDYCQKNYKEWTLETVCSKISEISK